MNPADSLIRYVIQGVGLGFAAAVQPGAFQTYVISQALVNGWRRTLPAALAPLVSDGPIIALMVLLLTRLPRSAMAWMHLASGLFILYLARGAFLAWRVFEIATPQAAGAGGRSLLKAATMNMLSPGPYMFWSLVAGPLLVRGWQEAPPFGFVFLGGFYAAMIITLGSIILLFGAARQLGPRVNRALLGISSAALAAFGVYQLWQGASGLLQ